MKKIQISYLGLNSLFGRVTTNLLKQSPCIHKLTLYDDDGGFPHDGESNLFVGRDGLPDAVKGVNIVVIGDEPGDSREEERLKFIGPKIIRYTEAILKSSPNAVVVVAVSPLNIMVPLVGHFLGTDWKHRLLGVTSVDTLRASRILNGLLAHPEGAAHILPVVGGSSLKTRVPLFSHLRHKIDVCSEIRKKILDKMKIYENANLREIDAVERAYCTVRFIHSVISGMVEGSRIPEIAMTQTKDVLDVDYFSLPVLLGKNGITGSIPLPKVDATEERLLLDAGKKLDEDSRKARDFVNLVQTNRSTDCKIIETKQIKMAEGPKFDHRSSKLYVPKLDTKSASNDDWSEPLTYRNRSKSKRKDGNQRVDSTKRSTYQPAKTETSHQFGSTRNSEVSVPKCVDFYSKSEKLPLPKCTTSESKTTNAVNKESDVLRPHLAQSGVNNEILQQEVVLDADVRSTKGARDSVLKTGSSFVSSTEDVECDYKVKLQKDIEDHLRQKLQKSTIIKVNEKLHNDISDDGLIVQKETINVSDDKISEGIIRCTDIRTKSGDVEVEDDNVAMQQVSYSPINEKLKTITPKVTVFSSTDNIHLEEKSMVDDDTSSGLLFPEKRYENNFLQNSNENTTKEVSTQDKGKLFSICDGGLNDYVANGGKPVDDRTLALHEHNYGQRDSSIDGGNKLMKGELRQNKQSFIKFKKGKMLSIKKRSAVNIVNLANVKQGGNVLIDQFSDKATIKNEKLSSARPFSNKVGCEEMRKKVDLKNKSGNLLRGRKKAPLPLKTMAPVKRAGNGERVLCLPSSRSVDRPLGNLSDSPKRRRATKKMERGESVWTRLEKVASKNNESSSSKLKDEHSSSKCHNRDTGNLPIIKDAFSKEEVPLTRKLNHTDEVNNFSWPVYGDAIPGKMLSLKSLGTDNENVLDSVHLGGEGSMILDDTTLQRHTNLSISSKPENEDNNVHVLKGNVNDATSNLVGDFFSDGFQNKLTSNKTQNYFMSQRNGSVGLRPNVESLQNSKKPQKKRYSEKLKRKKESQQEKKHTMKHVDTQKQNLKNERASGTLKAKSTNDHCAVAKNMVAETDVIISKKNHDHKEMPRALNNRHSNPNEDVWESKYFNKASEMFFKMFRDAVTADEPRKFRFRDVCNENASGMKSPATTSNVQTINHVLQKNDLNADVKLKDAVNKITKCDTVNRSPAKAKSVKVISTKTDFRKTKGEEISKKHNNQQQSKRRKKNKGITEVKKNEERIVNKLKQLSKNGDKQTDTKISCGGALTPTQPEGENCFKESFRANGMGKYQNEKFEKIKQEIPLNVDKQFEESSPIHMNKSTFSPSPASVGDKVIVKAGNVPPQSSLKELNATSDKGKGDAINTIDFSVYKSPSWVENAQLKNELSKAREHTVVDENKINIPTFKMSSPDLNVDVPKASFTSIPISSKLIKQVPHGYRNQIGKPFPKKVDEGTSKSDKTNKWERVVSIFKQIIVRDIEGRKADFTEKFDNLATTAKNVQKGVTLPQGKITTSVNLPVVKHSVPKAKKLKVISKSRKKAGNVKTKLPSDTIRGNKVIKNNPKKIVNYFSQRGQMSSSYEKPGQSNFSMNSYEQPTGLLNGIR